MEAARGLTARLVRAERDGLLSAEERVELIRACEDAELAAAAEGGRPDELLVVLMLVYALDNDLPSCRFLWERCSVDIRAALPQLGLAFTLCASLFRRDFGTFFQGAAALREGSGAVPLLTQMLVDHVQSKELDTLSRAYTRVSQEVISGRFGLEASRVHDFCTAKGWKPDDQQMETSAMPLHFTPPNPADATDQAAADHVARDLDQVSSLVRKVMLLERPATVDVREIAGSAPGPRAATSSSSSSSSSSSTIAAVTPNQQAM